LVLEAAEPVVMVVVGAVGAEEAGTVFAGAVAVAGGRVVAVEAVDVEAELVGAAEEEEGCTLHSFCDTNSSAAYTTSYLSSSPPPEVGLTSMPAPCFLWCAKRPK
jgi:hypothetical protein